MSLLMALQRRKLPGEKSKVYLCILPLPCCSQAALIRDCVPNYHLVPFIAHYFWPEPHGCNLWALVKSSALYREYGAICGAGRVIYLFHYIADLCLRRLAKSMRNHLTRRETQLLSFLGPKVYLHVPVETGRCIFLSQSLLVHIDVLPFEFILVITDTRLHPHYTPWKKNLF